MPEWIHSRAEHLLAKNPKMDKSQAFAIATQQSHKLGKSPKGYGTAQGKREAKAKYDKPRKEYVKGANPGGLETPKLAPMGKEGSVSWAFYDELAKIAMAGDDPSLKSQIGRAKVRPKAAVSPDPKFQVKAAMIPLGTPKVNQMNPQAKLMKSQQVGTPSDPKGTQFKPLHMLKPPKQPGAAQAQAPNMPAMPKFGFALSAFSGPLSEGTFDHPPMMPALRLPPVGRMDPHLKESGSKTPETKTKKASAALTPKGRLASSRLEGKPKSTGFSGPSIADVSKPIGYGVKLPGATKNRI